MNPQTYPIQFVLSRTCADALPLATLREKARAAGVEKPRFESNEKNARGGYRITCTREMGIYIVERLKVLADAASTTHSIDLLTACAYDIKAIFDAIEASLKPPASTGTEPSPY